VLRLLVSDNVVPSSPVFATLMVEVTRSTEKSVLTRCHTASPGDGIPLVSDVRECQYLNRIQLQTMIFSECRLLGSFDVWLL
jgi:hypothetical protein